MARWGGTSRGAAPFPLLLQTPHSPRKDPDSRMSGYSKTLLNTARELSPTWMGCYDEAWKLGGPSLEATVFSSQN